MYELILIPLLVAVIIQIIKLIIDGIPNNLNWQHLINDYGGMPSAHAALVASLATVSGLSQGFNSAVFAISFVLMVIVARDAVGFRREIGRHAVFTNMLARVIYQNAKKKAANHRQRKRRADFLILTVVGLKGMLLLK